MIGITGSSERFRSRPARYAVGKSIAPAHQKSGHAHEMGGGNQNTIA